MITLYPPLLTMFTIASVPNESEYLSYSFIDNPALSKAASWFTKANPRMLVEVDSSPSTILSISSNANNSSATSEPAYNSGPKSSIPDSNPRVSFITLIKLFINFFLLYVNYNALAINHLASVNNSSAILT